jgi:hypothetical protein
MLMRAPVLALLILTGCSPRAEEPPRRVGPVTLEAKEELPEAVVAALCGPAVLGERRFAVGLAQRGEVIPIRERRAELRPEPFELVLCVRGRAEVFLHAALSPERYEAAARGEPLLVPGWEAEPGPLPLFSGANAMAEAPFNRDRDLSLCRDAVQNLHYVGPLEHHFNEIIPRPEGLLALRRTVERLTDVDAKSPLPASSLGGRTLYLILVEGEPGEGLSIRERQRELLALSFR